MAPNIVDSHAAQAALEDGEAFGLRVVCRDGTGKLVATKTPSPVIKELKDNYPNEEKDISLLSKLLEPSLDNAPLVANETINYFESLGGALVAEPHMLARIEGMTRDAIERIKLAHDIACSVSMAALRARDPIESWPLLEAWLKINLRYSGIEIAKGLFLDRKNKLIVDLTLGIGTVDHVPLYAREIARLALEYKASAVILAHNHPSGDPTPSNGDIKTTKAVISALSTIDVILHDHVIVGRDRVLSMKQGGYI